MERLLPKYDYFKHTTRTLLTEAEKLETIEAIGRAGQHLGRLGSTSNIVFTSIEDGPQAMRSLSHRMVYFSRWVSLVKGSTQPRHLYRRRRRVDVEVEARKIAYETGADYAEIRDLFIRLMDKFIGEQP